MGFLGEIERRKQEVIKQEFALNAEALRRTQILDKIGTDRRKREELERIRQGQGFVKDCTTIVDILDQLHKSGYKDYFESVAEISGFGLKQIFYTEHPEQRFDSTDSQMTDRQLMEKGSELSKQQVLSHQKLVDISTQLSWSQFNSLFGIRKEAAISPKVMFFGENIMPDQGFTEPKEVGIGISFLKHVKSRQRKNRLAGLFGKENYDHIAEDWFHGVYIRIDTHAAMITGSSQHQLALGGLRLFDEALRKAIDNPATVYTRKKVWPPLYMRSESYTPEHPQQ